MIANALRVEVERYAASMPTHSPLFSRALEGTLAREHIIAYLTNMKAVIGRSVPHLKRAAALATNRGDTQLARHFLKKAGEEVGHETWADNDLAQVSSLVRADEEHLLPATRALIDFIEATIAEDPTLYLSYILLVEYLIVLLGDEWLQALERYCGIPVSSMTVVANHVELDRDHTEEALDSIDDLVSDPRKLTRMREIMLSSIEHFHRFTCDVVAAGDRVRDELALPQVSAA